MGILLSSAELGYRWLAHYLANGYRSHTMQPSKLRHRPAICIGLTNGYATFRAKLSEVLSLLPPVSLIVLIRSQKQMIRVYATRVVALV